MKFNLTMMWILGSENHIQIQDWAYKWRLVIQTDSQRRVSSSQGHWSEATQEQLKRWAKVHTLCVSTNSIDMCDVYGLCGYFFCLRLSLIVCVKGCVYFKSGFSKSILRKNMECRIFALSFFGFSFSFLLSTLKKTEKL